MRQDNDRGFTLLELLISITLTAVLVLILSLGLRTGLRAWSRGKEINERLVAMSAVNGLLGRQLRAALRPDATGTTNFSDFKGTKEELSFVTTSVPQGSNAGGIFRVLYRFDPLEHRLVYAQRLITRPEDLDEVLPSETDLDDRADLARQGWDVSVVPGIHALAFVYNQDPATDSPPEEWQYDWNTEGRIPSGVAVAWSWTEEDAETPAWMVFRTGPVVPWNGT